MMETGQTASAKKNHYKVNRGEPGQDIVIPLRNGEPVTENLPVVQDSPSSSPFSHHDKVAYYRFALINALWEKISENPGVKKEKIIRQLLNEYESKKSIPHIFKKLGHVSRPTLYRWISAYKEGGVEALIPQSRGPEGSGITAAEELFLRNKLLNQNRPTIGDSINKCKKLLGEMSSSHPAKLRRWVYQHRDNNFDEWILAREGEKALNDKCLPYAERDWRQLKVGDCLVADGHKLNFKVINPFTGEHTRPIMVMFWDWKSSYPAGWELMFTESIQCVISALRNAIIRLGKFPKHVLLDNGKAFRAKVFSKKFRFQETEIVGIFDDLSIIPHFARPYNPQSKPIERFFRTFNDWFERELPSYSGASINDKPAYMRRNEKWAKDRHNEWIPTIPETIDLIFKFREYYIDQELKGRDYLRPREIFEAEKGPGVDPFALHLLMMEPIVRKVHRNGITFLGWHWYHENLYGIKGHVLMFYSYYDLSQVYIFRKKNEFLCVAKPVEKVMPFAADSEFPEDMAAVQRINATKKKLINSTKKAVAGIQSQMDNIDWNKPFRDRPEIAEAIKKIQDKERKVLPFKPFSDQPESSEFITQNESEDRKVEVHPESNLIWWSDSPLPDTDSKRYEFYCEIVAKNSINLTDRDWQWIENYERSDEWKLYYSAKNPISKSLSKGEGDAREICFHQECQRIP